MTSKQRISITFVPAGQQAMHERLEREAGIAVDWDGDVHLWVDFYPPDKRRSCGF